MSGRIERIVVPFDATSETRGAIAVAASLAAHAKVQLQGVFMEGDLLHLADLPSSSTPR